MKKNEIIIYTDGSSLGNPGPGGWGAVVVDGMKVVELGGRENDSTNNRMELTGAIKALRLVQERKLEGKKIFIYTDSNYVLNGITMWIYGWVKNNWKTKAGEDVLNKDLWENLFKVEFDLKNKYEIEWIKVSGHSGVHLNERCDEIATGFSAQTRPILFTGSLKDYERLFSVSLDDHKEKKSEVKKDINKDSKKKAFSYVSMISGKVFVDKTWDACEKRVKGKSGAKYKKVFSKQEEQELIGLWSLNSLF
jgi:ribonuclease HI